MNIFESHLQSIGVIQIAEQDENAYNYKHDTWSPQMQRQLRRMSAKKPVVTREEEKRFKAEEQAAKEAAEERCEEERARRRMLGIQREHKNRMSSVRKDYDDQERLSGWLKKEFKYALIDVVEQLMFDDPTMDIDEAISNAHDMEIVDMVHMRDPKKYERLQQLRRSIPWDWEGWLFDEMAEYARKNARTK
jgi:hypothetical protein